MEEVAMEAIHLPCINILAIDLSYRETGFACLTKNTENGSVSIQESGVIKNSQMGSFSFDNMRKVRIETKELVEKLDKIDFRFNSDVTIIEMPAFTQSAKSAFLIGALWGAMGAMEKVCLVPPSFIKKWSGSKRGDKKEQVLKKVLERTILIGKMSNDNIVDAIAIGLCFADMVSSEKRKHNMLLKLNEH